MTSPLDPGLVKWSFHLYAKRGYWLSLAATDLPGAKKPTQEAVICTLRSSAKKAELCYSVFRDTKFGDTITDRQRDREDDSRGLESKFVI